MDRHPDDWKKYPLVAIGSLPAIPPGALALSPAAVGAPGSPPINNFYIIVSLSPENLLATLTSIEDAGALPDQVILHGRPIDCPPGYGSLEALADETAEEFRARLLPKLQSQRHQLLGSTFRAARSTGLERRLEGPSLAQALDVTRLAHSLCCAYSLSPSVHAKVLQACLTGEAPSPAPWQGEASPETMIPLTATLVHQALLNGVPVREALRERLSALTYRARNELLHHVENCVGALTGGKHAA